MSAERAARASGHGGRAHQVRTIAKSGHAKTPGCNMQVFAAHTAGKRGTTTSVNLRSDARKDSQHRTGEASPHDPVAPSLIRGDALTLPAAFARGARARVGKRAHAVPPVVRSTAGNPGVRCDLPGKVAGLSRRISPMLASEGESARGSSPRNAAGLCTRPEVASPTIRTVLWCGDRSCGPSASLGETIGDGVERHAQSTKPELR